MGKKEEEEEETKKEEEEETKKEEEEETNKTEVIKKVVLHSTNEEFIDKKIKSEETVENKSMNKELKKNDHIKDDMEKEKVKLTEGKTKKNDLGSNEEVQILERKKCRRRKSREEGELSHMDSEDIDNIVDWASGSDVNKSEKLTKKIYV